MMGYVKRDNILCLVFWSDTVLFAKNKCPCFLLFVSGYRMLCSCNPVNCMNDVKSLRAINVSWVSTTSRGVFFSCPIKQPEFSCGSHWELYRNINGQGPIGNKSACRAEMYPVSLKILLYSEFFSMILLLSTLNLNYIMLSSKQTACYKPFTVRRGQ